ncbi:hypothetical protein X777_14306 [Ooceraea biroi]|uniref:Protein GAMETE EXPRESSED n=1 Tax=Ooceraea biroi TaxID=2015173 RepID=A0A026VZ63_OOCBI|nr:hypothetical protein X777_14306 [Ooceraea biroi]
MIWLLFFVLHGTLANNNMMRDLGMKEYFLIKAKSSLPQHGKCWHAALQALEGSCDKFNDQEHSLLALHLANCFLEDSGHATYDCHLSQSEEERRQCINGMADRAFSVYREFYTHATHICFFLNHEAWQAEVDNTIKLEMQGVILNSQKEGLRIQNELLDHGKELGTVLKTSSETVNNMVSDFKESAKDQKELLYEIFSYMRAFQSWIIGEVSWIQSIIFYIVSCILCALFSSSRRTADARVTLFTILSLNIVAERVLVQYYNNIVHQSSEDKLENQKALRRIEQQLDVIEKITTISNSQPIRCSKRLALKRIQAVSGKRENVTHAKAAGQSL